MEFWNVMQDGGYFYVTVDGQDEPDVYTYPYDNVSDMDIVAAKDARAWFEKTIVPDCVTALFT